VIDLVIKNFGKTVARNVRATISPPAQRAAGDGSDPDLAIPDAIPVLVPGQEWRTFWDMTHARYRSELPALHRATV
jgi:hypothetical protein